MGPEGKLQAKCIRHLKSLEKRGLPIWWFKVHGGPYQKAGIPDLHITYEGRSAWIELKAPGAKASPLQESTIKKLRAAGSPVEVIDNFESFLNFLNALEIL